MRFNHDLAAKIALADSFTLVEMAEAIGSWKWTTRIILNTGIRQGKSAKVGDRYRFLNEQEPKP